jgi:hypothetical protein
MPTFNTVAEMLGAVLEHVRATGHEVISFTDARERMLGFSCADCPHTDGPDWQNFVWQYQLRVHGLQDPLIGFISSGGARESLTDALNFWAHNRFFEGEGEGGDPSPPSDLWDREDGVE